MVVGADAAADSTRAVADGAAAAGVVVDAAPRKYWRKESCWGAELEDEFSPTVASWSAKEVASAEVFAVPVGGSSAGVGIVTGLVILIMIFDSGGENAISGPFQLGV